MQPILLPHTQHTLAQPSTPPTKRRPATRPPTIMPSAPPTNRLHSTSYRLQPTRNHATFHLHSTQHTLAQPSTPLTKRQPATRQPAIRAVRPTHKKATRPTHPQGTLHTRRQTRGQRKQRKPLPAAAQRPSSGLGGSAYTCRIDRGVMQIQGMTRPLTSINQCEVRDRRKKRANEK